MKLNGRQIEALLNMRSPIKSIEKSAIRLKCFKPFESARNQAWVMWQNGSKQSSKQKEICSPFQGNAQWSRLEARLESLAVYSQQRQSKTLRRIYYKSRSCAATKNSMWKILKYATQPIWRQWTSRRMSLRLISVRRVSVSGENLDVFGSFDNKFMSNFNQRYQNKEF